LRMLLRNPRWWRDFQQMHIQIGSKSQFEFVPQGKLKRTIIPFPLGVDLWKPKFVISIF